MKTKPKIVIFSTGGTILSQMDNESGVVKPAMTGGQLLDTVSGLSSHFEIESVEFCNMPGSDLTLSIGLELSRAIAAVHTRADVDGVVVLQGTDTMDEIPYLVHLTIPTGKPVVFTGAMKSMHDCYSDAMGNVLGAACVAASPMSHGRGVLVYFNETIFSAADLIKSHASRIDAFESVFGPVGSVVNGTVHYVRENSAGPVYRVTDVGLNVPLLKVYAGIENAQVSACIDAGARGLVIEGYGSGNVPATMVPVLETALARGIPVVVATRCVRGDAYACYGYVGGGAQLAELGVILAGALSGVKSRIKLIVLLAAGCDAAQIRQAFQTV